MKIQPRAVEDACRSCGKRHPPISLLTLADDVLLSAKDVGCALAGISERQVLRLGIPMVDLGPRLKRFRIGDVRQFIASRTRDRRTA